MEQVADRPEPTVIKGLISAPTENIPIGVCLWAAKNRLFCFAMRPRSTSNRHNTNISVTVTIVNITYALHKTYFHHNYKF